MAQAIDVWKREVDEAKVREKIAEKQRDEVTLMKPILLVYNRCHCSSEMQALQRANSLQKEVEKLSNGMKPNLTQSIRNIGNLDNMSIQQLQQLKQLLRTDLECVDTVSRLKLTELTRA